jgi:phytanoyl-CoA hydroxylase
MNSTALPPTQLKQLRAADVEQYHRDGYFIARGLLSADQVQQLRKKLDSIGNAGVAIPNSWTPDLTPEGAADPLKRFPRVMMPHRYDALSLHFLLHPKIVNAVHDLFGEESLAAQSMFYFKPPGARGQALHQDDYYLLTEPDECMAAWVAIDPSLPDNGGLSVVPGSHKIDVQCPQAADTRESFVNHLVPPPPGMAAIPAELRPGDVLFFNGHLIHGSTSNRSATGQWRRSFICHYIPWSTKKVAQWSMPLLDRDGNVVERETNGWGGPCGVESDLPHIKNTFAP